MKNQTKRIVTATILTAGAATVAASVTAIKLLTDVAIDKRLPPQVYKLQHKVSGSKTDEAMTKLFSEKSAWLEKNATEKVCVTSSDGLKLTGHIYPADKPQRVVIAFHGWRSSWSSDYGTTAEVFHDNNCTMIYPDQRSQGESEGEHIGFGVLERKDVPVWVDFAVQRFGTDIPIYLCGISMGAATVLMAADYDYPPNVKGILADCGFTSPHAIWSHVMSCNLRINEKLSYPIANYFINKKASYDGDEYSTLEALSKTKLAVLIIHGDADTFVPVDMAYKNYNACSADKELLIVHGAGHGMSYFTETENYQRKVLDFFKRHDN